ncbi:sugar transferase [Oceanobacillus profundus]|uniref:sugar transferase n=1 Tax=Oceanobacillus profundus TaxID=372463 RepID=UPI0026E445FA|nr:sugar transferase [Oceanobacillus profundus]MDO6450495.1 sugar transferase [Oceanobacillus profundus]
MNSSQKQIENPYVESRKPFQLAFKRLFDIAFSLIVLILLIPVFLILAFLIIKEDGRPVFFKQQRSGKLDIPFGMYKFRSMKVIQTSEGKSKDRIYEWKNGVPDEFIFKTGSVDNPNITKIGKFIRKYSLDELPQFYNVFKGDMSVIGPRPEIIEITRCYSHEQKMRLSVKPGISGWAQANGRSEMNHGEKIKHDLYYVNNFSLWLDLKILFRTIWQVLSGKGSV